MMRKDQVEAVLADLAEQERVLVDRIDSTTSSLVRVRGNIAGLREKYAKVLAVDAPSVVVEAQAVS
jgi:hypothetical protein